MESNIPWIFFLTWSIWCGAASGDRQDGTRVPDKVSKELQHYRDFIFRRPREFDPEIEVKATAYRSNIQKDNCAKKSLVVCARSLEPGVGPLTDTVEVNVSMPTGWVPDKSSLMQINTTVIPVELVSFDDKSVLFSFKKVTNVKTCVTFEVQQVNIMNPKPALIKVNYGGRDGQKFETETEYEIKTTCGTKEEIPLDNRDVDCSVEQCREDIVPLPLALQNALQETGNQECPLCLTDELQIEELLQLTCDSTAVYKVMVGKKSGRFLRPKANIRQKKKEKYTRLLTHYSMPFASCECSIIDEPGRRLLIFSQDKTSVDTAGKTFQLFPEDTILPYSQWYEDLVRKVAKRRRFCSKFQKIYSGPNANMLKLMPMLIRHNFI